MKPVNVHLWERLSWDSDHFGIPVARILKPLSSLEMQQFQQWHNEQEIECTYFLCPIGDLASLQLAQQRHFSVVDLRVQLECSSKSLQANSRLHDSIRPAQLEDLLPLQQLAIALHQDSRFFVDKHFARAKAEALYSLWMKKEIENPEGVVLVMPDKENKPVGYLSCQAALGKGTIGLFGVAEGYQGRGIGTALLSQCLTWMKQQQATIISVITQGKNTGALATYTGNGFRIKSMSLWMHRWSHELAT